MKYSRWERQGALEWSWIHFGSQVVPFEILVCFWLQKVQHAHICTKKMEVEQGSVLEWHGHVLVLESYMLKILSDLLWTKVSKPVFALKIGWERSGAAFKGLLPIVFFRIFSLKILVQF